MKTEVNTWFLWQPIAIHWEWSLNEGVPTILLPFHIDSPQSTAIIDQSADIHLIYSGNGTFITIFIIFLQSWTPLELQSLEIHLF